jgi:hypothetical protein
MANRGNRWKSLVIVRIYVEGGGDQGSTKSNCRQAFRLLFEKIISPGSFRVIACGGRSETFRDFCIALRIHSDDYVILLVDSEAAVGTGPWKHLETREGDSWNRPAGVVDLQAHLMVQTMEAWLLADRQSLSEYYGQGFLAGSLPGQPNVELIAKVDAIRALQHASRPTQKGEYHKTRHGFDLLERANPALIRSASSHADRLFTLLAVQTTR